MLGERCAELLISRVAIGLAGAILICLPTLSATAQTLGTRQSTSEGITANSYVQATLKTPERVSAQNLIVQGFQFNSLLLNKEPYRFNGTTMFFSSDGRRLTMLDIKPGQVVDIVFLTGGTKTETYPYHSSEKVLSSVRVVGGGQQR